MRRYHGPYPARNRWRIDERTELNSKRRMLSFDTRAEAEAAIARLRQEALTDAAGEALLAMATPMPDECSWVYLLRDRGEVVYVGCGTDPWDRVCIHREHGKVFTDVMIIPTPLTRAAALHLEAALITLLKPRLNIAQLGKRSCDVSRSEDRTVGGDRA